MVPATKKNNAVKAGQGLYLYTAPNRFLRGSTWSYCPFPPIRCVQTGFGGVQSRGEVVDGGEGGG